MGVVFQESLLDDELTVEENLDIQAMLYFSDFSLRKQQISRVIGLTDLNNHRYKKSAELSGGLKKRLEIARGLLNDPKVLFLDEPTLGLDPIAKNNVWAHIKNIKRKQKKTIIIATNDMIEAEKLCDNILIIDKGKRCWYGTKQQLKKRGKTIESAFINILRDNNE
jgi:ABC-2 type transport system ATP-binding protein